MIAAMGRGLGACACAVALACGLAWGSVAAAPHVAFAEQAGDDARVVADDPVTAQEPQPSAVVADGNVRLTKLTDATVLVELLQAQARTSASVKLGALDAQGNALGGCTFAFTPEALALASCHAVSHDDLLTVVVSNGTDAITADSDRFVLGTLTVPADTARVAVLGMEGVTTSGGVDSVPGPDDADDALSMLPGDGPGGDGDPDDSQDPAGPGDADDTQKPGGPDGSTPPGSGDGNGGAQGDGNADGAGGTGGGSGNGPGGSNGGSGSSGGTAQGGKSNLPRTGDGQVVDASALLLIAGAAALTACVVLFFRRGRQR